MPKTLDRSLSHTSMKAWRRCLQQYHWHYVNDYDPMPSKGQMRGSSGHAALAHWYMHNYDDDGAMNVAAGKITEYEQLMAENYEEDWQDMQIILPRYFTWARANDLFDSVIACEQKFDISINGQSVIGYLDGIVTVKGVQWLLEHKFWKSVRLKGLELDPQVSLYLLAARKAGYNVRGVFYNIIRTTIGGIAEREPVVRQPMYRNHEALKYIEAELGDQINQMQLYHELGGKAYRTPTEDCSWDCGFYNACLAINDDGNPQPVLDKLPSRHYSEVIVEEEENDN